MILTKADILASMRSDVDPEKRLFVTPLLEDNQVGDASVDLRLGCEFVVNRRANLPYVAPLEKEIERAKWQEHLLVPRRGKLILHPGELILGVTFEYVCLPSDVAGYVTSRSSWGRQGLIIATALAVAPRYRGVITLELTNVGNAPLVLSPGVRIAQIVFHKSGASQTYGGRYRCTTRPEVGKIDLDSDLEFWTPSAR